MTSITYPPEMLPTIDPDDEVEIVVLNCAYCGGPLYEHVIANGFGEPGEVFCSDACYDAHLRSGCPLEKEKK